MKYRYVLSGTFDGDDGSYYSIDIPVPILRDSKEEAEQKDDCHGYRIIKYAGEPRIFIFDKGEWEGYTDDKGEKRIRSWVEGVIIGMYSYTQFIAAHGRLRKLKETSKHNLWFSADDWDWEDVEKSFSEIFPDMKEGDRIYIDDPAYHIAEE